MTDIQSIIAKMTLEEKAALCTGASAWTTTPIERLGVPDPEVELRYVPDARCLETKALKPTFCSWLQSRMAVQSAPL